LRPEVLLRFPQLAIWVNVEKKSPRGRNFKSVCVTVGWGDECYKTHTQWTFRVTRGRCYDHNFRRFFPIFGEKLAFILNTNVMINFFQNLALCWVKNANFFANIFDENI
jgi:hypothetical protein